MTPVGGRAQLAIAAVALCLGATAGASILVVGRRTHVVTVDAAVERFRAAGDGAAPSAIDAPAAAVQTSASPEQPLVAAVAPPAGVGAAAPKPAAKATTAPTTRAVAGAPSSPAAPGTPVVRTPRNGVYTYATKGQESVTALGGATHTYPATTTVSVTGSGCSQGARWDALEERYEQLALCAVGEGTQVVSFTTYHSFYGQSDKKTYACEPAARLRPESHQPGASASGACVASNAKAVVKTSVVGIENVRIGGVDVPAVKVHGDEVLTGATAGKRITDSWFALADNLLLRRIATVDADTESAIGQTHYTESYDIQLTSTTPRT
jgi:hypothetical protein